MAGIQVSGLLSNSAFDWKSVVDQLVAAEGIPMKAMTDQKSKNSDQVTALASLKTTLGALQDSVQAIRAGNLFSARSVSSDVTGTTWKSNSSAGAALGSYKFTVQQLATAAKVSGASDIGRGLSATSDVSGLTIASLPTASAVTAGTFSVNGNPVTVALTDSLQDVFSKISTATGGDVTASYDPTADGVTLTSTSGSLVLGAANDTSNFLSVMKLSNNGTGTASSLAGLGTLKTASPLASSGLRNAITAVDGSGNGSFTVNGVAIAYNVNTDSLNAVLDRVNQSTAGVSASYDSANDRVVFTNKKTGDMGLGLSETGAGFLSAVGAIGSGATTTVGKNALFKVNDGPVLSSMSNTLDASTHGIAGLSVTVNTQSTQTVNVDSDTTGMHTAVQDFLDKFNAVQDFIETNTKIDVGGGKVTTSVLSSNREVQGWAQQLRSLAFDAVSGLTGTVQRLDNLGIDFDSTTGHLTIKQPDKLNAALNDRPDDVQEFFLKPETGMVSKMYGTLTDLMTADGTQQENINKASAGIDDQMAALQRQLDSQREILTTAFIKMLDAQSAAQNQNQALTNAFFKNNN